MLRRNVLQVGAVAVLPAVGCAETTQKPAEKVEPSIAPASGGPSAPWSSVTAAPTADEAPSPEPVPAPPEPTKAPEPPPPTFSRVIARIGKNHGHELLIAMADVLGGADKSYEIAGTSGHKHSVTLTAAQMKSLLQGDLIRTESSRGFHAHRVVVRCAPDALPPEWVSVCHAEFSGKDEHEIVITQADMAARAAKSYEVQGLAGHSHEVKITAEDFQKLERGEGVSITTSRHEEDAHLHVVFIQYKTAKKG